LTISFTDFSLLLQNSTCGETMDPRAKAIKAVEAIFDRYVMCIGFIFFVLLYFQQPRVDSQPLSLATRSTGKVLISSMALNPSASCINKSHNCSILLLITYQTNTPSYRLIAASQNFQGFDKHVMENVKIIDASPKGTVTFEFLIDERYSNVNGVMHGGAAGVIFDMCTTSALGPLARPGQWECVSSSPILSTFFDIFIAS